MIAVQTLKPTIKSLFEDNYHVYGRGKIKAALRCEYGLVVEKDRVARLMRELGRRGMRCGNTIVTTKPDKTNPWAPDLVEWDFSATWPIHGRSHNPFV